MFGILLIAIGSIGAASFYVPFKRVKSWAWESYWITQGLAAWIICPWVFALLTVPSGTLMDIIHDAPASAKWLTIMFGALWGVGGLTFGLSIRYMGIALGQSLVLGLTAALGTLIPAIVAGDDLLTVILRPHLIWGPEDSHIVPRIISRAKQLLIVGNGKNVVDTIYIDNAAYAHILAAEKLDENPGISGNIYFISQGKPVLLWEMINNILKAGGLPPVKHSISHKAAWLVGTILELVYNIINIKSEPVMTRFVANELAKSHWFDISAAQNDLGYIPLVSTKEGLKRLEFWLKGVIREI